MESSKNSDKASAKVSDDRVQTLAAAMVAGLINRQALHGVAEGWGLTESQVNYYIKKAKAAVANIESMTVLQERQQMVAQYDALIQQATLDQEWKEVRAILKDKAALLGLIKSRFVKEAPKKEIPEGEKDDKDVTKGKHGQQWGAVVGIGSKK